MCNDPCVLNVVLQIHDGTNENQVVGRRGTSCQVMLTKTASIANHMVTSRIQEWDNECTHIPEYEPGIRWDFDSEMRGKHTKACIALLR